MKTETQIAQENIEELVLWREGYTKKGKIKKSEWNPYFDLISLAKQSMHKATCQRFLEFLEETHREMIRVLNTDDPKMEDYITDLKQAIKLYEDAGI